MGNAGTNFQLQSGQPMGLFSSQCAKAGAEFWGNCFPAASASRCAEPQQHCPGRRAWVSISQGSQSMCGTAGGCRCPSHEGPWRARRQHLLLSPLPQLEGNGLSQTVCHPHNFLSLGVFFPFFFLIQVISF